MGKPVAATVVYDSGAEERFDDVDEALSKRDDGRIEFHYDYGPHLLPPPAPSGDGIWRYRNLLPIAQGAIRYPLPVGDTPLVAPPVLRDQLAMPHLYLKDETRGPTGSNKDRATAIVLHEALTADFDTVSCASTGNVAVSLAVGAAAVGKRAVIFVPAEIADSKLHLMLLAGATVIKVTEGYEAAFRLSREAARAFGWLDRNTGYNPATLDGKKTVALEIWEQVGREAPDVVIAPVGDGPTLSALVKGWSELAACGAIARIPRIIGVQAEGCQPVKRAWESGKPVKPETPRTIADGIAVGAPVSAAMVLRDVRRSRGDFVEVSDEAMLTAIDLLATRTGILAEPAGAAAFAGLLVALERRLLDRDERTVVLVTGSALKTPHLLAPRNHAVETRADLGAVQQLLDEAP